MNRKIWTSEETEILSRMYPDHYASEIAAVLGRSVTSVYGKALHLGLRSSKEKIVRSGRMSSNNPNVVASRFQPGNVPFNKGKKLSAELYAKAQPTMFRKGNVPWNHKEIGAERVTVDGYIEVKVAEQIIDVYKVQVDALKVFSQMDNVASGGQLMAGMGIISQEERKMIGG